MLSGWSVTLSWWGSRSKSQRASMSSSPLLAIVAESMVIFAPIDQFGCSLACWGVMSWSWSIGVSRQPPPEAVRIMDFKSFLLLPWRHWKMALCSESMGRRRTLFSFMAWVTKDPPRTSNSLLASAISRPFSMALRVGERACAPTIATTTMSAWVVSMSWCSAWSPP